MAAEALLPLGANEADHARGVVVIGAGVIGLAVALRLQQHGHAVLVIDRSGVAAEASRGNAGAFAFSDILPLASPGILRQAPRWLLDPLGPLALRPAYLPRIAPWLWRFWRASSPRRVAASTAAQVALLRLSAAETPGLLAAAGAADLLHDEGNLHLYGSEAAWRAAQPGWRLRAAHGIAFGHRHGAAAIAELQAGLSPQFVAATFVPGWQTIDDPLLLVQRMALAFRMGGGRIRRAAAVGIRPDADGIDLQLEGGGRLRAGRLVVAAGAWAHQLSRHLREPVPLETERGYNTTLPRGAFQLQRQLSFVEHGFVVTRIAGGVRVGGAVELAGLAAPPNYARADALLDKAKAFMPGLRTVGGTRWMGLRPSLPDSLPVIGPSAADGRVFYAFGHGHLGLTEAAATAAIVQALVDGRPLPGLDLRPYRIGRFR